MKYFFRKLLLIIHKSFERYYSEKGAIVSNGLAFKTLFAIIPVFALFISITSVFPSFTDYKNIMFGFILKYMLPGSVDKISVVFDNFISNMKIFSIIGIVGTLYISLDLFISLDNVLNKVWSISENRTLVQKVLIYWLLVTMTPIFFSLYFYYSTVIRSMVGFFNQFSFLEELNYTIFSFIVLEAFVFFLYYVIPNTKVDFRKAVVVSIVISLIMIIFRFIFNYYTRIVLTTWILYGSISVVIFFMIWISLNWSILLFGAEVLSVWQNRLYKVNTNLTRYFLFDIAFILLIIYELKEDFQKTGHGITINDIVAKYIINSGDVETILNEIELAGLIVRDPENRSCFYLKRDISSIYLSNLEDIVMKNIMKVRGIPVRKYNNIVNRLRKYYYSRKQDVSIDRIVR